MSWINTWLQKEICDFSKITYFYPDNLGNFIVALKYNNVVKELNLSRSKLSDYHFVDVGTMLQHNNTIIKLDLSYNDNLKDDAMKYLAEGLVYNKTLKSLNLHNIFCGDNGLKYLVNALKINTTLECLYFFPSLIKDDHVFDLTNSFYLKHLTLFLNYWGKSDFFAKVFENLKNNQKLESIVLFVCTNNDDKSGKNRFRSKLLVDCLKTNNTLKSIKISHNYPHLITNSKIMKDVEEIIINNDIIEEIDILDNNCIIGNIIKSMLKLENRLKISGWKPKWYHLCNNQFKKTIYTIMLTKVASPFDDDLVNLKIIPIELLCQIFTFLI